MPRTPARRRALLPFLALSALMFASSLSPLASSVRGEGDDEPEEDGGNHGEAGSARNDLDRSGPGGGEHGDDEDEEEDEGAGRGDEFRLGGKGVLGALNVSGTRVEGRFVSFGVDFTRQDVEDFAVGGVPLFDRIAAARTFDEFDLEDDDGGTRVEFGGDDIGLRIHDNPTALIKFKADGGEDDEEDEALLPAVGPSFTVVLADGVTATFSADNRTLALAWDNATGTLHSNRPVRRTGDALMLTGEAVFLAHAPRALLPGAANHHREEVDDALARGRVGAQVTVVQAGNGTLVTETLSVRDLAIEAERTADGLRLVIDAEEHRGTVLVLNVDRALLAGNIRLRFFDTLNDTTVELPIVAAASLADVLDPSDDGLLAEFRLVRDADGLQLLVSIPGFSAKVLEIATVEPFIATPPPLVIGGVAAAVVLVAVAAFVFFRRPREEPLE